MDGGERRNLGQRAAVVRRVIRDVVHNPNVTITLDTLQAWLNIPMDAAERILHRLAASGLLRYAGDGVWTRLTPDVRPSFTHTGGATGDRR